MRDPKTDPPFEAIREILDHYYDDEERHLRQVEDDGSHIFYSLVMLRWWLDACGEDRPSKGTPPRLRVVG